MKHAYRYTPAFCGWTLAALLAAVLGSCTDHQDPLAQPEPVADAYEFGLYVSVGDNAAFAASLSPGSGYEPGSYYENYIDLPGQDYRIYLFDSNNTLIADIDPADAVLLPAASSAPGMSTYELRFALSLEGTNLNPANCTFKLLMIANWGDYPQALERGVSTIDDIMESGSCLQPFAPGAKPGPEALVPMFGVNQFANKVLDPQFMTHVGSLQLLRALAKVEVYDDGASGAEITAVSLTRHNTALWCAPKLDAYMQGEYAAGLAPLSFRPAASAESSDAFRFGRDEATGHFVAYVPEYVNVAAASMPRPELERSRICIEYADGRSDYLEFKYYDSVNASANGASTGDYFNIRRNYWYRYCVSKGSVVMAVKVDQVPYVSVSLNPGFGFDDPLDKPPSEWVVPPWVEIEQ